MFRKPLGITFAALAALSTLAAGAASAQTVDELIAKNIQAKGGLEKLKAVQGVRMTGKMEVGPGVQAPFTIEMKRPHKVRMEFTIQGMTGVQAYDGTAGWLVMPFMGKKDPEAMSADDLKNMDDMADFEGPLVEYKAKGHQVELIGKEDVEGTPAWKLKLTKKNGDVSYIYLDADAFLEIKEEGKRMVRGQEIEYENVQGDYKQVDGLTLPFSMVSKAKGAPSGQTMALDKIELNASIDDGRFAMPKAEPADKKEGAPKPQ